MGAGARQAALGIACALLLSSLTGVARSSSGAADRQLDALIDEHWQYSLAEDPTFATSVGRQ